MAIIEAVLNRLIRRGHLRVIDAGGKTMDFGQVGALPQVTVRFHDKMLLFKLAKDFTVAVGEAYMDGRLTIENGGTLHDLLEVFAINYHDAPPMPWDFISDIEFFHPLLKFFHKTIPVISARKNAAHHYDFTAELYRLFLDKDMQYSCGYFTKPDNDIDTAQHDKKRNIAAKLQLQKGQRVLDIGSGFGGLPLYLAKNFQVHVTGITLSETQYKVCVDRVQKEGLEHLVQFQMLDYREVKGTFDRVVSVGMFEHVGLNHFKDFFAKIYEVMPDGGVALLQSVGRMDGPGKTDTFMEKYFFPDAYAPALSEVLPVVERSGLWITDIETLWLHYAETLNRWQARFWQNREEIKKLYDERFCKMWEIYLVAAEMDFRYLNTMVFQMQMRKGQLTAPTTRNYMYEAMAAQENVPRLAVL
jgi:cyclopropane-fatty-acyl-phospholipid synthase